MQPLRTNIFKRIFSSPNSVTLCIFLVTCSYFLALHYLGYSAPLHLDTARDFLKARDCANGNGCSYGISSSFGEFKQGSGAFIRFLALSWRLQTSYDAVVLIFYLIYALSVSLFHHIAIRSMGSRRAFFCTMLYLAMVLTTHEYPLLDNPLFATPFALLCFYGVIQYNLNPSVAYLLLASTALAFCIDTHIIYTLLAPALAAYFAVRTDSWRVLAVSTFAIMLFAVQWLLAPEPFLGNVMLGMREGYAVSGFASLAGMYLVFSKKKESLVTNPSFLPAAIGLYVAATFLIVSVVVGYFELRYLMPGICYLSLALPGMLDALVGRIALRMPAVETSLKKAIPALQFMAIGIITFHIVIPVIFGAIQDDLLVSDVEAIARYYYGEKRYCFDDTVEKLGMLDESQEYYSFLNMFPAFAPSDMLRCKSGDPGVRYLIAKDFPGDLERICGVQIDVGKVKAISLRKDLHLIERKPWIKRDRFEACFIAERGGRTFRSCELLSPGEVVPLKFTGIDAGGKIMYGHMAYQSIDKLKPAFERLAAETGGGLKVQIEYAFEIDIPEQSERRVFMICVDKSDRNHRWHFSRAEGIDYKLLEGTAIEIGRGKDSGIVYVRTDLGDEDVSAEFFPFPNIFSVPVR